MKGLVHSDRLKWVGERGLLVVAAAGCYGTYVSALTLGLRAFLPLGASLAAAAVTFMALELLFIRQRRRQRSLVCSVCVSEPTAQLPSCSAEELREAA